jgi:hypothetical protein
MNLQQITADWLTPKVAHMLNELTPYFGRVLSSKQWVLTVSVTEGWAQDFDYVKPKKWKQRAYCATLTIYTGDLIATNFQAAFFYDDANDAGEFTPMGKAMAEAMSNTIGAALNRELQRTFADPALWYKLKTGYYPFIPALNAEGVKAAVVSKDLPLLLYNLNKQVVTKTATTKAPSRKYNLNKPAERAALMQVIEQIPILETINPPKKLCIG